MLLYDIYHDDGTMDVAVRLPLVGEAGDLAVCINGERTWYHAVPMEYQHNTTALWQCLSEAEAERFWPRPAQRRVL